MPTLNKYASSNEKTGYFIRANVGDSHPVTLQTTGTAEQIFKDNGYSDGSNIPTKLVWSMYDVDLLYTESSVSSDTPSYSFDSLSDAVTGSELTEGTRQDLIRYFEEYSGVHQKRVNKVLDDLTPVEIDRSDITSTVDAPSISEMDIPKKAFVQSDSDLLVGVVDRISSSDNPLVEVSDGHLLLDSGNEGGVYLIDRVESRWGRVLCELTRSDEEETLADTMPLLDDEAFRDVDIEHGVVDAAASYHETHHEIVTAQVSDGRVKYATRAVMPDGSPGPRCGFSVGGREDTSTILEIIAHPEDKTGVVNYEEPGIRHQVVLTNDKTTWETAVTPEFEDLRASREALLTHQVAILQIMNKTLNAHTGCEPATLISDIVSSGHLEDELIHPAGVWENSTLLADLLADPERDSAPAEGAKCTGTVDFFNDTGGYGFIETDAYEDDVFYHMDDVGGPDITEGEEVRFNIKQAEKGPRANDVERVCVGQ